VWNNLILENAKSIAFLSPLSTFFEIRSTSFLVNFSFFEFVLIFENFFS
jgi:hypothetical protein